MSALNADQAYAVGYDDGFDGYAPNEDRVADHLRFDYLHGFNDGEIAAEMEGFDGYADDGVAAGPVDATYFAREMAP